jgi:hypothetical protein
MFVVRPVVQWLTTSSIGDTDLLRQLPKTVGEIEREYGGETKSLPFRDRALEMMTKSDNSSVSLMKDWLNE